MIDINNTLRVQRSDCLISLRNVSFEILKLFFGSFESCGYRPKDEYDLDTHHLIAHPGYQNLAVSDSGNKGLTTCLNSIPISLHGKPSTPCGSG